MEITPAHARQALTALRLTIGTVAWLTPRLAAKLFGVDPDDNPAAPYVARLFGARDIAMGAVMLEGDEDEVARWIDYGIAIDAADVAAAVAGGLRGYLPKRTAIMAGLAATSAVGLGVIARDK